MLHVLNTRGLNISYEGNKIGTKFIVDCSNKAYAEIITFTIDNLSSIVYLKYNELVNKFWKPVSMMMSKQDIGNEK